MSRTVSTCSSRRSTSTGNCLSSCDLELDEHLRCRERIDADIAELGVELHARRIDVADRADGALDESLEIGHGLTSDADICESVLHRALPKVGAKSSIAT